MAIATLPAPWVRTYGGKRVFDICCATILLIAFSPLFLGIALVVRLTSRGPIIFTRTRVGKNGLPFKIYKFRSMYMEQPHHGRVYSRTDPRITPVGRLLRGTHLDELPQLWNVLIGDMSMVGPRPVTDYFALEFMRENPRFEERLIVLPGITGLTQICGLREGRSRRETRRIHLLNRYYIRHRSFPLDCWILARTPLAIIRGSGM